MFVGKKSLQKYERTNIKNGSVLSQQATVNSK